MYGLYLICYRAYQCVYGNLVVNVDLKALLQQGISASVFNDDLVYTFKRLVGKPIFTDHINNIINHHKNVGQNF